MAEGALNPWKYVTIGILLVLAAAGITTMVVAKRSSPPSEPERSTPASGVKRTATGAGGPQHAAKRASADPASAPPMNVSVYDRPAPGGAAAGPASTAPSRAVVDACNRYAAAPPSERDKMLEIGKDALIGGAATAGLGAAAGAIAGGGSGAGKGAGIGGLLGVAGGVLYGINENRKADAEYQAAYAKCMRARGYSS